MLSIDKKEEKIKGVGVGGVDSWYVNGRGEGDIIYQRENLQNK